MADIKTHLRELSVATSIGVLANNIFITDNDKYIPKNFFRLASQIINNDISCARNILEADSYANDLREIIDNGFRLGNAIFTSHHFNISNQSQILWLGNNTHQILPIDIQVGHYKFSLKEESFILRNMGLYEFVNNLTGSNYRQGDLHIFRCFAPEQFNNWFCYTWNSFKDFLNTNHTWQINNNRHNISSSIVGENIIMNADNFNSTVPLAINNELQYFQYTNPHTREHVFAKWIKEFMREDTEYLTLKRNCSITAGNNLCSQIRNHISPNDLAKFFRIYETEYYYAKVTSNNLNVLKIPSISNFPAVIQFNNCTASIPSSQLNILTSFKNTSTGNELIFRNECRYSHGQFNGTPEAKMYITQNTSLTDLYEPII